MGDRSRAPEEIAVGPELAWLLLLELRRRARSPAPLPDCFSLSLDTRGQSSGAPAGPRSTVLEIAADGSWAARVPVAESGAELFDLYLPMALARRERPFTAAHLGQSLDGRIATLEGASSYVNGPENLIHLHRMRALCDAVLVGASTVACDNPQLTTRRVVGPNPVRVILDPRRRLASTCRVFQDRAAPTLVLCDAPLADQTSLGHAEVIGIPCRDHRLDLEAALRQLRARGLFGVFVEGGGLTVSAFLERGLLDRLQIAVAPLILGSGRPGITLPPIRDLSQGLRPRHRRYAMGEDVLFDCGLRG